MKPSACLIPIYDKKKSLSVERVKAAINLLVGRDQKVTYSSIRDAVFELSDGQYRISETTISRNSDVRNLYIAAASPNVQCRSNPVKAYIRGYKGSDRTEETQALRRLERQSKRQLVVIARKYEMEIAKLQKELACLRAERLDQLVPTSVSVGLGKRVKER